MKQAAVPTCDKCEGIIKPDIVFFGEPLPKTFDDHLSTDCHEADLVIVIGSSLKVHPVSDIPDLIPPYVPQILINRESLDHNFDIELLGDCDVILAELFRRLGWTLEDPALADRFQELLLQETSIQFVEPHYHLFPGAKPVMGWRRDRLVAPLRSHSSSPPSSESLVGCSLREKEEEEEDFLLTGGIAAAGRPDELPAGRTAVVLPEGRLEVLELPEVDKEVEGLVDEEPQDEDKGNEEDHRLAT